MTPLHSLAFTVERTISTGYGLADAPPYHPDTREKIRTRQPSNELAMFHETHLPA